MGDQLNQPNVQSNISGLSGTDIALLASQVFDALAGSEGIVGREAFKRCSSSLAQLSADFESDQEDTFNRIDTNENDVIERDEFLGEIQNIKDLLGTRTLAAALAQVHSELQAEGCPSTVGDKESLEELMIRGQVMRKIVDNFDSLQGDYTLRLQELEDTCNRLRSEQEAPTAANSVSFAAQASVPSTGPGLLKRAKAAAAAPVSASNSAPAPASKRITAAACAANVAGKAATEDLRSDDEESQAEDDHDDDEQDECDETEAEEDAEDDEGNDEDEEEEEHEEEVEELAPVRETPKQQSRPSPKMEAVLKSEAATATSGGAELPANVTSAAPSKPKAKAQPKASRAKPRPVETEKQKRLQEENKKLRDEISKLKNQEVSTKKKLNEENQKLCDEIEELRNLASQASSDPAVPALVPQNATTADAAITAPASRSPRPAGRGEEADKNEGARCVQTLDLGIAVKAAFCLGDKVWTIDTQGRVSIRERDNPAKVKAEIPTHRFVCCISHLEPGLMLMGQERDGIQVFDMSRQQAKALLGGGHAGNSNVWCIAMGDTLDDSQIEDGRLHTRRFWSGSNDFTIRQWIVDTWKRGVETPPDVEAAGATIIDVGRWKVGISRGLQMYGHKLPIKCLLKIGPILWSGSDDGSIRLWYAADSVEAEVLEKAHEGTVEKLSVVRSYVWSCGSDGLIKEWTIAGSPRQCVRQVSPEGFEKIYAICPLGYDVWTCGHHPNIKVYSQKEMEQANEMEAHKRYTSNLLAVDRIETKIVWSTSLGDKKLKVWRHTVRGDVPNFDEMKAANMLYEEEQEGMVSRMNELASKADELQQQIATAEDEFKKKMSIAEEEFKKNLEDLARRLAAAQGELADLEARKRFLKGELDGLRKLFDEAGLGELMDDPEGMRAFLDRAAALEHIFKELGLEDLLENPEDLKRALENMKKLGEMLEKAGFGDVLNDPTKLEELRKALETIAELRKMLEQSGFGDIFSDPSKLEELRQALENVRKFKELFGDMDAEQALDALQKLKDMLEECGFGDVLKDPSKLAELEKFLKAAKQLRDMLDNYGVGNAFDDPSVLAEILSRYNGLKQAFDEYGFSELFEDPYTMKGFLRNYGKIREAFRDVGLEYLMDSSAAMRDFLSQHAKGETELKDVRLRAAKLAEVEAQLRERTEELSKALAENESLTRRLAEFEAIGSLADIQQWKKDAAEYRVLRKRQAAMDLEMDNLRRSLEEKEQERQEALERERLMSMRYKELDIFKLDIIARELKALDKELDLAEKEVKHMQNDCDRIKSYTEREMMLHHGGNMRQQLDALSSHIKDVIEKCLSETQKLHIGSAINDPKAAGELKDGGVMAMLQVPDHGHSNAARLRQADERRREQRRQ